VCAVTVMVPPLREPGTSLAGPLAAASIAFCCVVIWPAPWLPPELLLVDDGLPQPAMPMARAAVAATATLNRVTAISPLLNTGRPRHRRVRGSNASRMESPSRLSASTRMVIASTGIHRYGGSAG